MKSACKPSVNLLKTAILRNSEQPAMSYSDTMQKCIPVKAMVTFACPHAMRLADLQALFLTIGQICAGDGTAICRNPG